MMAVVAPADARQMTDDEEKTDDGLWRERIG
jgi:hypothetical protein